MCFDTAAFDTKPFQYAILYQKEGHLILYPVICMIILCTVNRFEL